MVLNLKPISEQVMVITGVCGGIDWRSRAWLHEMAPGWYATCKRQPNDCIKSCSRRETVRR
jgi:hypothetical protein